MDDNGDKQAWDRLPGESFKAYRAFRAYLDRGMIRSQTQCAHDLGCTRQLVRRWSVKFSWVKRTEAWDAHVGKIEQDAKERVAREKAELWAKRQMDAAERSWEDANALRAWAEGALAAARVKGSIGAIVKVFTTAGATRERAILIALQALSEDDGFDPMNATPEQLRAYLAKRGVKPTGPD